MTDQKIHTESGLPIVTLNDMRDPTHAVNKAPHRRPFEGIAMCIAEQIAPNEGDTLMPAVQINTPLVDCPVYIAVGYRGEWKRVGTNDATAIGLPTGDMTGHETSLFPWIGDA